MTQQITNRYTLSVKNVFLERVFMNWMDKQYKAFFNANERFADMVNGSIFNGKQVLSAGKSK